MDVVVCLFKRSLVCGKNELLQGVADVLVLNYRFITCTITDFRHKMRRHELLTAALLKGYHNK